MGVTGLTSYIADRSSQFLTPYKLSDSYVVIDGYAIANRLYSNESYSDTLYGGDYDEYWHIFESFFTNLKRCRVEAIVLFDGAYEKKKISTIINRGRGRAYTLEGINKGLCRDQCFPAFTYIVLKDVLTQLRIKFVRCEFEADAEIATLAKLLNCPVISNDSDFYILDVLYIPCAMLSTTAVTDESDSRKHYMPCSIYEADHFVSKFPGLDKSLLPVLAVLLGNDYCNGEVFRNFFNHVAMPGGKNYNQRKIHGLLQWLSRETTDTVVDGILLHLKNSEANAVRQMIQESFVNYHKGVLSSSVHSLVESMLKDRKVDFEYKIKPFSIDLPLIMKAYYNNCTISSILHNLINLNCIFTSVIIQDVSKESCHMLSLPFMKAVNAFIHRYKKNKSNHFSVFLVNFKKYIKYSVDTRVPYFLENFNWVEVLSETREARCKLLFDIVGIAEQDRQLIWKINNDWSLFLTAFLYWMQSLRDSLSCVHVYSLLLMAVANRVVQKEAGFYRTVEKFMKRYKTVLSHAVNEEINDHGQTSHSFNDLLCNVTKTECILLQRDLMNLRKTVCNDRRVCSVPVTHWFNAFQSCLNYISQINALLNMPLPMFKISDFFSGTLLFNLYMMVSARPDITCVTDKMFAATPNLRNLYNYLLINFVKCPPPRGPTKTKMTVMKKRFR